MGRQKKGGRTVLAKTGEEVTDLDQFITQAEKA